MLWLALTFLQLVLHHHQEGHAYHEEVEAETDLAELSDSLSTHFPHYVLIGFLSADGRGIAKDDQTTDEEHQGNLQEHRTLSYNLQSQNRLMVTHKHTPWTGYQIVKPLGNRHRIDLFVIANRIKCQWRLQIWKANINYRVATTCVAIIHEFSNSPLKESKNGVVHKMSKMPSWFPKTADIF